MRGFGASEASRIQKLAAPTASMAEPLARFEGFEGFEGFEAFEGQFQATRKKGFWRARAPSPQSAQLRPQSRTEPRAHSLASVRGFGASEVSRIQKLAAPTASMAHSLAQSPEPTV